LSAEQSCGARDFDPNAGTAALTAVGSSDIFLAKYNTSGNYVWAFAVGTSSFEQAFGVTVVVSGNSYITGSFNGTADLAEIYRYKR
jgi:hypothetical protein